MPRRSPCYPLCRGGPTCGLLDSSGILRNLLEASRYNTKKTTPFFWNPKYDFPYTNIYLSTIPRVLVVSGISSRTPNNIWLPLIKYSNTTLASTNVKRATLRVRELCSHDRDTSPVNNQQRNLDAHIGSHIFYEDLYRSNRYDKICYSLCPSVCYLPEIRSSVSSYLIQSRYRHVSFLVP